MVPVSFAESNCVFDKPRSMTRDECTALSAWIGRDSSDNEVVISCWKLTAEDLRELQKTGRIWLYVYSTTLPPVALTAVRPWEETKL